MRTVSVEQYLAGTDAVEPASEPEPVRKHEPTPRDEFIACLRRRRAELAQCRPGAARAARLAASYLAIPSATLPWARWALQMILEAESRRKGPFWEESNAELARILGELENVADGPAPRLVRDHR